MRMSDSASALDWISEHPVHLRAGLGGGALADRRLPQRARAAAALVAALLAAYAARTFVRNWDWETEEALFRSAEKVACNFSLLSTKTLHTGSICRAHPRAQPAPDIPGRTVCCYKLKGGPEAQLCQIMQSNSLHIAKI